MKKEKKKRNKSFRFLIKTTLCLIYFLVMLILSYCAFQLYEEDIKVVAWNEVQDTKDYTYITFDKMSEKFATIDSKKDVHFIIDEEKSTGIWHVYLLAISPKDYNKYKKIIDYTYERTTEKPKAMKVYGYPVSTPVELKELTIKNYKNFVSFENEVELTLENFNEYLTNVYLDTTKKQEKDFNWFIVILLILDVILLLLIVVTIFDKDRIVDEVDRLVEREEKKRKPSKRT